MMYKFRMPWCHVYSIFNNLPLFAWPFQQFRQYSSEFFVIISSTSPAFDAHHLMHFYFKSECISLQIFKCNFCSLGFWCKPWIKSYAFTKSTRFIQCMNFSTFNLNVWRGRRMEEEGFVNFVKQIFMLVGIIHFHLPPFAFRFYFRHMSMFRSSTAVFFSKCIHSNALFICIKRNHSQSAQYTFLILLQQLKSKRVISESELS